MNYFQMVEDAWDLSDAVRAYVTTAGREVDLTEIWEKIFSLSPLIDEEKTGREGGIASGQVFLKSPYGLRYRPDTKDWIPFRHGQIDLSGAVATTQ